MVFLVLLSYSLPNGTVQTSDSGFIVREKNIPTAALTDLRTHRNQVFDFMRQKGDFFDGNSCYLTTEFNIKKVEHFLDKQKKKFIDLLFEASSFLSLTEEQNLAEHLVKHCKFRRWTTTFSSRDALSVIKDLNAIRASEVLEYLSEGRFNLVYPKVRTICTSLGRWSYEYPELTTLRNEVTPLASIVQSTDDWDAQQISLRDFVIDTMTRLSMWSDDKERLEMVSSASYKPEGYLL